MFSKAFLFATVLMSMDLAYANKKEVVFFGGGGEPAGDSTIFDRGVSSFMPFMPGSGWTVRPYFNGGHKRSENIARMKFGNNNKPMTSQNVRGEILNLRRRIESGDLKQGDQLMLTIYTHGATPKDGQKSHSVSTTDGTVDLDEVIALRDIAEKKGVKLAIVDMSCHSGNTLNLASDKTCVVSATGEGLGYNTSSESMGMNLIRGSNLEMAFIRARRTPVGASPQISSPAGRKTYAATKFLHESMEENSRLGSRKDPNFCYGSENEEFKKLARNISEIRKNSLYDQVSNYFGITAGTAQGMTDKMQTALDNYANGRKKLQESFDVMESLNPRSCRSLKENSLCGKHENFEYGYSLLSKMKNDGKLEKNREAEFEVYKQHMESSEYQRWKQAQAEYKNHPSIYPLAKDVGRAEREIYEQVYLENAKDNKEPNPCKDFVL